MSIIADTLQRLQTPPISERLGTPESPSIVIPIRGKREPGWHNRPSRLKFWFAGLGMAIGLSGLGIAAYWIGFHLDFGLSTYASQRTPQSMALSGSIPNLRSTPFDSPSTESMQMPVASPIQDVPTSASLHPEEEASIIQNSISSATSDSSNNENSLPSALPGAVPVSSEIETRSIDPIPLQLHQTPVSTIASIPNSATELAPTKERAEPKPALTSRPDATPTRSDKTASPVVEAEVFDVTEPSLPVEVAFEEERISQDESSSTPHLLSNTTAMIPKKGETSQKGQSSIAVKSFPGKLLGHAQQLIQAEQYEEAHALLDPLFKDPPVNWEPWFWMGTALLGQRQLEQADQFFLSGLARNDKIPQLWIQRALVAHQRGEYQLAIHELRRAESLDATLPHVHLNMGYAYDKLGNERLAHEYYVKFLKLSEGNPAFFSIRKKLYARFTEQIQSTPHPGLPSSLPENP